MLSQRTKPNFCLLPYFYVECGITNDCAWPAIIGTHSVHMHMLQNYTCMYVATIMLGELQVGQLS